MVYVIFEDMKHKNHITNENDLAIKIHRENCGFYNNKKLTSTTKWHGPFNTLLEAEAFAQKLGKPWRRAHCCLRSI